jgi:UPF0176 protein
MPISVAAFYRFQPLADPAALRQPLLDLLKSHGARGIVLLAPEGINATIAAPGDMAGLLMEIARIAALDAPLTPILSTTERMPFRRLKVRLKREIVTIGDGSVDPRADVGSYVASADWNALISDPDVLVIDTRNSFEVAFGTFEHAVDPKTHSFGELPAFIRDQLAGDKFRKIAMFCTGGIRCEKATSLLKREGFQSVFHLKGGILSYLRDVPETDSLWHGGCFVFDERVALGHGLKPVDLGLCLACNAPVGPTERASPAFEEGVCCPFCADRQTAEQKRSARDRQRQMARKTCMEPEY